MHIRNRLDTLLKKFEKRFTPLNRIEIIEDNVLYNYDFFSRLTRGYVWPVLQANAYGHGLKEIATILQKRRPQYFAVDSYFEALKVWDVAPHQNVLLLAVTNPVNFKNMNFKKCAMVVYSIETIRALGALERPVRVHLKINTGMNRQGIEPAELDTYIREIKRHAHLELEGVCTHFADADGENDAFTNAQQKLFSDVLDTLEQKNIKPRFAHSAATNGSPKIHDPRCNAMRLGIGLYGFHTLQQLDPARHVVAELKPALRFVSTIIKTREVGVGDVVGYNCTFKADKPMRIGLLPVGYYEVYDRRLSNKGFVRFKNHGLPIIGRISMNLTTVDLEDSDAQVWDEVEIISPCLKDKNSIPEMAALAGTIPYELLTSISETVRRVVV